MTETTLHAAQYNVNRSSLSAVIAGTIVALGLMVLFTLLGLAIGVASIEAIGHGLGIGAAIYIALTHIISIAVGGYAAARFMSPTDKSVGMMTGAAVWALTTIIVTYGGINAGTAAISTSTALVAQTAKTTANAVQAVVPDDISLPDMSEIAESVSMSDLPPELQQILKDAGITPAQLRAEANEAFRNVVSRQEMNRARSLVTAALSDIVAEPASASEEMDRLLDKLFKGENAVFNKQDLDEAKSTLQTRLGITENEAEQIVESVENSFNSAIETVRQEVSEMQERLVDAAEKVQSAVTTAVLWLFIASLLSLIAAAATGCCGRRD